jgi:hypothetical protein
MILQNIACAGLATLITLTSSVHAQTLTQNLLVQQQQNTAKTFITKQQCDELSKMMDVIKGYEEELLFMGEGMSFAAQNGMGYMGGMMFFTNQETGTWSMLQLYRDGTACLVTNGRGFVPYSGPKMSTEPNL